MSKSSSLFYATLIIAFSVFVSCKKTKSSIEPDPTPAPIKSAKFEISGNYSGHLLWCTTIMFRAIPHSL